LIFSSTNIILQVLFVVGACRDLSGSGRPHFYPTRKKLHTSRRADGGGIPFLSFRGGIEETLVEEKLKTAQAAGLKAA
jgi:hypothetical protein